ILEKRPAGTYDHLICLREDLQKNRLNSVIIISSPYHMRRVNAVSKKVLTGYAVSLVPVQRSIFFGNRSAVKLRHIRAILHEYLALLYYGYKRYI
ncbi:MAG: YdcF family protein, partial [Candidatus Omnitrophica bacterium]|nr:YdcF family protein [Candidatus Omnitrophota bacterium]